MAIKRKHLVGTSTVLLGLLVLAGLVFSSGCARTLVCDRSFPQTVEFFEKKYAFDFAHSKTAVRYVDLSEVLNNELMKDGENPASGVIFGTMIESLDDGIIVTVGKYEENGVLDFNVQENKRDGLHGTRDGLHITVNPINDHRTKVRAIPSARLLAVFSREPRRYLKQIDEEIRSGKTVVRYSRTKIGNYYTILKQTIKNRQYWHGGF